MKTQDEIEAGIITAVYAAAYTSERSHGAANTARYSARESASEALDFYRETRLPKTAVA